MSTLGLFQALLLLEASAFSDRHPVDRPDVRP
jgi:hypothetical protein